MAEVDTIADGFDDGTFRPYSYVPRGQFAKMAVNGLDVSEAWPTTATFPDVPVIDIFFSYVEGAVDAGLIHGLDDG